MNKLQVFLLMVTLLTYAKVNATGQQTDIIIYRDSTMNLCSLPLYHHPDTSLLNIRRFFKSHEGFNTGNGRGYVATWSISDGHLFLIRIQNPSKTEQVDLEMMFGDKYRDGKVIADWFTGSLYCGIGKIVFYIHDGFLYSFEKELEINILKGAYVNEKINDNSKSRQVDYDKFFTSSNTSTNGYKEHLDSLINWLDLPPIDEKGVRSVVQFSANEDGIIDDVKVIRSGGDIFDREAIRIVKTFPGNVQFYHGKLRRYYFTIPIVFNESTRLSKISKK